jgi:hypothetical protein
VTRQDSWPLGWADAGGGNGGFQQALVVPVCTRATLQAAVDSYLEAQKTGDAKKIAFGDKAT